MNTQYYNYKNYLFRISNRSTFEKLKHLTGGTLTESKFNQLVEKLIHDEYNRQPTLLGI
tara:strand:+ start:116 stop:292 length:177 start_codon:yes stop_codon:yes gene_type:complete